MLPNIERAAIADPTVRRSIPAWVLSAIEDDRAAAARITDPVRRRVAEIEIDQRAELLEAEFREGAVR